MPAKITQEEYQILGSETLRCGTYASNPVIQNNQAIIDRLRSRGLIRRKQDWEVSGNDEFFYEITSAGRLEVNLFERSQARQTDKFLAPYLKDAKDRM